MIDLSERALALLWTQRLIGLAALLQTIELLQLRRAFSDEGVWSWRVLREEQRELAWPLRSLLGLVSPYPAFASMLVLRVPLALALLFGVPGAAVPLLITQLAVNARFRGTFNGGSDYMSVIVLLALSLVVSFPAPMVERLSLAYICAQLVFSYFIAGVVKIVRSQWRTGAALRSLVASNRYGAAGPWARLASNASLSRGATWLVLGFECAFPVVLFVPGSTLPLLTVALAFHVANAYVFGLNRFVWAWLAAYPALLHFSALLGSSR